MKATLQNGILTVEIPVNAKPQPSSSGKTLNVASSNGNKPQPIEVNGQTLYVGLNAYIYPPR